MFQQISYAVLSFLLICGWRLIDAETSTLPLSIIDRINNDAATASLTSYLCDDELLKKIAQNVEKVVMTNENLRLQLSVNDLRLEQLWAQNSKELLANLKETITADQYAKYSHFIDVRDSFTESNVNTSQKLENKNERLPQSCAEAVQRAGPGHKSGIYQLHLPTYLEKPFYVYCLEDKDGGPAWTIVQRREDGSQDFFRNWAEYKRGFGNLHSEFFIGLDKLHALTHSNLNELWIHMQDFDNVTRNAKYEDFAIEDESYKYALNVLGSFMGDAGDSLRNHQGRKFSTHDADHDTHSSNCAQTYTGAWWYAACHNSNLNGQYLKGNYPKDKYAKGIDWNTWHGHQYSLKYVHMAIRPKVLKH